MLLCVESQLKPDFNNYSIDELIDAAENIDKEQYPERYATIIALLKEKQPISVEMALRNNESDDSVNTQTKIVFESISYSKALTKSGEIKIVVRALGPTLVNIFGFNEFYEVAQVNSAISNVKADESPQVHFAYALFCSSQGFYTKFNKEEFDYRSLRLEVAVLLFGEPMLFTMRSLIRYAKGEYMKGNYRLHDFDNSTPVEGGGAGLID